jgi:hypothetical protein
MELNKLDLENLINFFRRMGVNLKGWKLLKYFKKLTKNQIKNVSFLFLKNYFQNF